MGWLKKMVRNWLTKADEERPIQVDLIETITSGKHGVASTVRIGVTNAINGRILEIATYKHNPHGPDWTSEYFLVREDELLSDAITMMLLAKNIK